MKTKNVITPSILFLLATTLVVHQILGLSPKRSYEGVQTVNISAYFDRECKEPLTTLDWGMLEPGSTKSITIYVKNTGTTTVTLSLSTENWSPEEASKYLSLTWNYKGQKIQPGKVISLTLTLSTSSNMPGMSSFSFNIIIAGVST